MRKVARFGTSWALAAAGALAALAGCSSNHDDLAAREPGAATDGGAGGAKGDGAADAASDAGDDAPDGAPGDGGDGGTGEPAGTSALTLVHGLADAPAMRVCLVPMVDGGAVPGASPPLPDTIDGLAAGARFTLDAASLPGVDLAAEAVQPVVLTGDLAAASGRGCAELLAPAGAPAGLVATALPVLPAGTLTGGRPYLLVPVGCVGADHAGATAACGASYAGAPNASLVVVAASRKTGAGVALQVLHAVAATQALDVGVAPADALAPFTLAPSLAPGALGPKPAASAALDAFGTTLDGAAFTASAPGNPSPLASVPVEDAIAAAGADPAGFRNGTAWTVVLVGSTPGAAVDPPLQPFRALAIPVPP